MCVVARSVVEGGSSACCAVLRCCNEKEKVWSEKCDSGILLVDPYLLIVVNLAAVEQV